METLKNVELIFWNLSNAAPTVEETRVALATHRLSSDYAGPVAPSTAFRRAVKQLVEKDNLARFWTRKSDGALCVQIDNEQESGDGHLRRELLAIYALRNVENGEPCYVEGERLEEMAEKFREATVRYVGGDVSQIIQKIITMDGLGAYSPRKGGGIYFVPIHPEKTDLLNRIETFGAAVGVRLLRYEIPDTGAQRDEIAEAIDYALRLDLATHEEAIDSYTNDTRQHVLDNRAEALTATGQSMLRLANLLPNHITALRDELARLEQKLVDKRQQIQEANSAVIGQRRRRILVDR